MDASSLIVIVTPTMTLITLLTGIALSFIAGSRSGRSRAAPARYLYVPCIRIRYHGSSAELRRWVQEVPIVKQTAKCIYYTSDSWDRREAVVSPGCISRDEFETDTRCHEPGGCGDDCQAGIRGWRCAKHGYTWEHCPHGEDRCRRGYPAGVIPVPGARSGSAGWLFFATRRAAEDHLYRGEGERAEQGVPHAPSVKELRRAMADAHPDRGGTTEQFIDARRRYQTALQPQPAYQAVGGKTENAV
jgi:hypothetical protein